MYSFFLFLFALMHNEILPLHQNNDENILPCYIKSERQEEDEECEIDVNSSVADKSKRQFGFVEAQYINHFGLPIGYRFKPTDHEIVQNYLWNKVMNKPLPANVIQHVYSSYFYKNHPKNIVSNEQDEKEWYFFIQQDEKKFVYKKMREVGNDVGFWRMENEDKKLIKVRGTLIGYNIYIYRFFRGGPKKPKKTHWRMHEYRLTQLALKDNSSSIELTTKEVEAMGELIEWLFMDVVVIWLKSGIDRTFPDEVLELDRVVWTVDLTHNKIVDIPVEINKLINMQRLILAENLIERLPLNLGKLQSLKVMTFDGNRLSGLPDELGQLVRLEQLSVSRNVLTYLPETLGSLRNDVVPFYCENLLIPSLILVYLKLLNASNNQLRYLPESIGSCFSLEELQANDNSIDELPPSVCNLNHLKSLSLNNNKVKQMPATILRDCKALQSLSLHNNPISMDQFQQLEGFQEFEARRRKKFDKQIDSNVMMNSKDLEQGVDT